MLLILNTYDVKYIWILKNFEESRSDIDRLSIYTIDDKSDIYNVLYSVKKSHIRYIIVTGDPATKDILINRRMRFVYSHVTDDLTFLLETAFKMVSLSVVPVFRCYKNPNVNPAGILPMVFYEGRLTCILGIDKRIHKYSDFGGSYDEKYKLHTVNTYKNTILQDKQIKDGCVDQTILTDHLLELYNVTQNASNSKIIGNGDLNTKYTAFRELIEESSYASESKPVYTFDIETVFRKLYVDKAFMYLGGDKYYKYDMYVVFFNVDELSEIMKEWFLKTYDLYNSNKQEYLRRCDTKVNIAPKSVVTPNTSSPDTSSIASPVATPVATPATSSATSSVASLTDDFYLKIEGNNEMAGFVAVPLDHIVRSTTCIDYREYSKNKNKMDCVYSCDGRDKKCFCKNENEEDTEFAHMSKRKRRLIGPVTHKSIYGTPILDNVRWSFADALVKYSREFSALIDPDSFTEFAKFMNFKIKN